jgi:hypothetical protein
MTSSLCYYQRQKASPCQLVRIDLDADKDDNEDHNEIRRADNADTVPLSPDSNRR